MNSFSITQIKDIIDSYYNSGLDIAEPLYRICTTGYPCLDREDWIHKYEDHKVIRHLLHIKMSVTFTESTPSNCHDYPHLQEQRGYVYITQDLDNGEIVHYVNNSSSEDMNDEPDFSSIFGEESPHHEDTFVM